MSNLNKIIIEKFHIETTEVGEYNIRFKCDQENGGPHNLEPCFTIGIDWQGCIDISCSNNFVHLCGIEDIIDMHKAFVWCYNQAQQQIKNSEIDPVEFDKEFMDSLK